MHFFRIFHTSIIRDKRLELPKEFTLKYGKELSDNAIFKVPNGTWHIGIHKADEGVIWFENGWPEFMKFYSICVGHLILFKYDGNSIFQVHIFGVNATEIDYPSHIDNTASHQVEMTSNNNSEEVEVVSTYSDEVIVESTHSDSDQSSDEPSMTSETPLNQKPEPVRREFPLKPRQQKMVVPLRFYTEAFQAALDAAEAFTSEKPFFNIIVQASYIKGPLKVPLAFANSYMRSITLTRTAITLRNSDGGTWDVGYVSRAQYKSSPTLRWYKFVADNRIKEGDVCVLELVDRKKLEMMNVHIFRQQKTFSRKPTPKKIVNHTAAEFPATFEAAKEFTSENPFFKVIMQPSYMKAGLAVPAAFATSHFANITQMVITLRVSDGRTWEVGYVSGKRYNRNLSSHGWRKFVADNDVKKGDVCVFELVECRKNFEMNVHIFRL